MFMGDWFSKFSEFVYTALQNYAQSGLSYIFYIIKIFAHVYRFVYLYVSYSWPNGWTELADIFLGNQWVPRE